MERELQYIENLKSNESFFEEEFSRLENYYVLDSKDEIHDFVRENEGILVLLDAVKPFLDEYFSDAIYQLYMSYDHEIENEVKLVLLVKVNRERFHNGAYDDLRLISREILPFRRKINVLWELLIMAEVLNVWFF